MFKDEVRKFGQELGIHRDLVMRHPFPGYVFLNPLPSLYLRSIPQSPFRGPDTPFYSLGMLKHDVL